jgi:hypothetical protein
MADKDLLPLTPAQLQVAGELPWYRDWLLSTGRTEAELEGEPRAQRPVTTPGDVP